jgi:type IV secretory pathway VirB2 component (pilin)
VKKILPIANAIIAVGSGVLVLLGYFLPGPFSGIQSVLLQWAIILAAFALLLGIINLVLVHLKKIRTKQPGSIYSIVLLLSLVLTVIVVSISGPTGFWSLWIFNTFQVPVEVSLLAVLAIVLVYAGARLLRRRPKWYTVLFIVTALVVLLGSAPLFMLGEFGPLSALRAWLSQVPAIAGARGLLLGVALGTIATGLRILMGLDRPYGG